MTGAGDGTDGAAPGGEDGGADIARPGAPTAPLAPTGPAPRSPGLVDVLRLLWDHSGRIAAVFLGIVAVLALLFLAIIGQTPALVLLVVVVVGVAMIALGGRIRA